MQHLDSESLSTHPSSNIGANGSKSSFNMLSILEKLKLARSNLNTNASPKLEYLFEDETTGDASKRMSWNTKLCYGTGSMFLMGLGAGGLWGLLEGLTKPEGSRSYRLRLNFILNSMTTRGPFLGNSLGVLALIYNLSSGAISQIRHKDDVYASLASGSLAGALLRSSSGLKSSAAGALLCGGTVGLYHFYCNSSAFL